MARVRVEGGDGSMSWIDKAFEPKSTVSRSSKQEKKVAKHLSGRRTVNSGAAFAENDVVSKSVEIECKITAKDRYSVSMKEWDKLTARTDHDKMPAMVIELGEGALSLAVITYEDFLKFAKVEDNRKIK